MEYKEEFKGKESTFWLENCPGTNFPKLKDGLNVDVAVLGGGIVGVTTATLLKESGFKVALVEADRIVEDVTVGTTAKISAAPNVIYERLVSNLGRNKAQKFADASMKALEKISEIVKGKALIVIFTVFHFIYTVNHIKMRKKLNWNAVLQRNWGFQFHTRKMCLYHLKQALHLNMIIRPSFILVSTFLHFLMI